MTHNEQDPRDWRSSFSVLGALRASSSQGLRASSSIIAHLSTRWEHKLLGVPRCGGLGLLVQLAAWYTTYLAHRTYISSYMLTISTGPRTENAAYYWVHCMHGYQFLTSHHAYLRRSWYTSSSDYCGKSTGMTQCAGQKLFQRAAVDHEALSEWTRGPKATSLKPVGGISTPPGDPK
jgi:hypothetical protein